MATINLSWDAVTQFTDSTNIGSVIPSYRLDRRNSNDPDFSLASVGTDRDRDDEAPEHPFTYYYRVRVEAQGNILESAWVELDNPIRLNRRPVITGPATVRIPTGTTSYAIQFMATDPDGDALNPWTYRLVDAELHEDWTIVSLNNNLTAELRRSSLADEITEDNISNQPTVFILRVRDIHFAGSFEFRLTIEYYVLPPPPPNSPPEIMIPNIGDLQIQANADMDIVHRVSLDSYVEDDIDPDSSIEYSALGISGFNDGIDEDDQPTAAIVDCSGLNEEPDTRRCLDITIPSGYFDDITKDPDDFTVVFTATDSLEASSVADGWVFTVIPPSVTRTFNRPMNFQSMVKSYI